MHYELYLDSLFLINLCMNLYLLMLVDHSTYGAAVPWRLGAGAAVGAVCSLLPFFWSAPAVIKLALGGCLGTVGMLCIAFPVRSLRMFLKLLERLLIYSFGIGGGMLFLIARLPFLREYLTGVCGVLGVGGVLFLFFRRFRQGLDTEQCLCGAVLTQGGRQVSVTALIDSGNGLTEPISGKPVCVVDRELYDCLWGGEDIGFRAIPYHSVGKRHGIMQGYLLSKLLLDVDGMRREFKDVYVAVSGERLFDADSGGDIDSGACRSVKEDVRLNKNAYSTIDLSARRSAQMGVKMIVNPRLIGEKRRDAERAAASGRGDKRKKAGKGEWKE